MIMVSIVIPFYSNFGWLKEAVQSVLAQTYTNYEIIVINDGSREDDTAFRAEFGDLIRYKVILNSGPAAARNEGIRIAKGKYIAFLDSDDLWLPDKLLKQVGFMERYNADWSHTNYYKFPDGVPEKLCEQNLEKFSGHIFPQSLISTHIATPCVMINRSFLEEQPNLRFRENMKYGEDYFLWLSLSVKKKLYLIPEPLSKIRLRGTNANNRAWAHIQVRAQAWNELKSCKTDYFYSPQSNFFIRSIYRLCYLEYKALLKLEDKIGTKSIIENIAKVLYVVPFLSFKVYTEFIQQNKI